MHVKIHVQLIQPVGSAVMQLSLYLTSLAYRVMPVVEVLCATRCFSV